MKYPQQIKFDLKGIYLSIFLILLSSVAFIVYGNKFDKAGHLYVLLGLYALLMVYILIVFIRTWWPAIVFNDEYIYDNHRILGLPRKIFKSKISSCTLQEKYTKRGESRFIEITQNDKKGSFLILDDRIDCTIDELKEYIDAWTKA